MIITSPQHASDGTSFADGSTRRVAALETTRVGRGIYLPGWRWSSHVGAITSVESARHIGYVLSGRIAVREQDGAEGVVGPGDAFELGPGSDAWVVGDEPCVALDFEPIAGSAAS